MIGIGERNGRGEKLGLSCGSERAAIEKEDSKAVGIEEGISHVSPKWRGELYLLSRCRCFGRNQAEREREREEEGGEGPEGALSVRDGRR